MQRVGSGVKEECPLGIDPSAGCTLLTDTAAAQMFADLTGVPVMVQKKPYEERLGEFRPFTCSDFIIPMLAKLCPEDDKVDRYCSCTCVFAEGSGWMKLFDYCLELRRVD